MSSDNLNASVEAFLRTMALISDNTVVTNVTRVQDEYHIEVKEVSK